MRTSPQSLACADRQTEVRAGKGAKCAFDEPGCSIRARRGEGVQAGLPKSLIVWERRSSRDPLGSWGPWNSGGSCRAWDSPAGRDSTHSRLAPSAQPPSLKCSPLSWSPSRNRERSASRSDTRRRLTSEKRENGHGSRSPSALTWMKPFPAALQPLSATSLADEAMRTHRGTPFSEEPC